MAMARHRGEPDIGPKAQADRERLEQARAEKLRQNLKKRKEQGRTRLDAPSPSDQVKRPST